ncbi:MAG: alkaline phosphatase family protein [Acidobacteria bacterium]|nr:alkaline phosphatase family protein [Acidobacteriota bacterium]
MKTVSRSLAILVALACLLSAAPRKPKLVVGIVVDQFRYDYLTRYRNEYKGGFDRLLTQGAVFGNARYEHFPTVTAIGHSVFMTGATPSVSGIVGNSWYDRDEARNLTSVSDDGVKLLGGPGGGCSPRELLVSTVGDELKIAGGGKPRVIGISLKDRAAILPAGHMADGAYWFNERSGNFVSSTFYFADLPDWAKDFNASRPAERYKGASWLEHKMPEAPEKLYPALEASPFGNELVEAFAERAIQAEQLGRHDTTDLLTVSFSSNDYVGHRYGPDSPEVHEISLRTDRLFDKFFRYLDAQVGMANVLVVMTGDHGVAPVPEVQNARRMPGGRMRPGSIRQAVTAALGAKFGDGNWLLTGSDTDLVFNLDLIRQKNLDRAVVERTAAEAALTVMHVFRVFTREQLMDGHSMEDQVGRRVMNGFYVRRSPDVTVLLEPYWLFGASGTTHGTTFSYDSHVPVIFMGPGIQPARYVRQIMPNDIAPTLATILDVETPSGSMGRALAELF